MSHDDFEREISAAEREQLERLAARLVADRPLPRPAFRGELRRQIATTEPVLPGLRLRVATYLATGVAMLAVAALGVNDVGPLAPSPPADAPALAHVSAR